VNAKFTSPLTLNVGEAEFSDMERDGKNEVAKT